MVCQTAFRRKSNIGPVGPTANHQQGWWFVTWAYARGDDQLFLIAMEVFFRKMCFQATFYGAGGVYGKL